ncbi:MAG: response regulator [Clostridia bacterium]|nr:response regulator [Clostridia bacterium]
MNQKYNILLVEDDARIRSFMETVLTSNGYNVLETDKARTALSMAASHNPDLMLLDLGLSDMDGQQVIRSVREWSNMPIVVVSARGHESDKVTALDNGADDYVTKPFGMAELLARIRAALRNSSLRQNSSGASGTVIRIRGLMVDTEKRIVKVNDVPVHLTQIEYKIVALLSCNAGKVLTYDVILKEIWGPYASCDTQLLRVNMANIRRKIEKDPSMPEYITTEIGVGYRMADYDD